MKKIKNIIFDVGNVLFKYNPEYIINCLLPKSKDSSFYLDQLFNADIWQQLDKGSISISRAIEIIDNNHQLSSKQINEIRLLISDFYKYLILDEDMKRLFIESSKHYNVYILSNFQSESFLKLKHDHTFLSLAKGEVVSANVKMMKPEFGIYHYLISQEKILPEESVFIDDMEENIAAANSLLINGICHKSFKQTQSLLKKLNVNTLS